MALDIATKGSAEERLAFSEKHGTLYAQVANVLRQRIRSGQWAAGDQLPTLGELEREFQVARVTLRQALTLLEADGMIWRKRGRGTFVSDGAGPEWFKLETSRDELIHSLEGTWSRIIEVDAEESVPRLDPGDGEAARAYRHMRRVHGRGDRAYAVVDMYLDAKVYKRAPKRFDKEMIIPVIDGMRGIEIADIRQTLTIGTADKQVAEGLGVPIGSPIGILRRVVQDDAGRAVYIGTVNYRGDVVKLDISLSGNRSGGVL
ncbi:MAG: GntR family transcriptional regulator [Hyphomicrobiaceae bacterium]|nr:GntR family transcriptional regulator [Hyphomicrobiaceae bacterium]